MSNHFISPPIYLPALSAHYHLVNGHHSDYITFGKIEPTLFDEPNKQPDTIIVTLEQFETIIQRLEGELLKGVIVPKSEDEIPKLMYSEASA
jgi:hypothetical protein